MWISKLDSIRHHSCCGKIPYKDEQRALDGLARILARHGYDGQELRTYYCVFCNNHHIGRKPKPTALKILSDIEELLRYGFSASCALCSTELKNSHGLKSTKPVLSSQTSEAV